ncbi:unnamed protein product [Strongylus vulgaris]|uniref:PARG catalytic Macro domain-containing protein n=1 Tax=Strongylus vulgaris TaxID=40348 RepID=A0A3P7JGT1_STRVU|nr:unnamed protein product [Strongylus vulgaris]
MFLNLTVIFYFLQLRSLAVTAELAIEDVTGCAQVDFADEYIGGLILSTPIDQVEEVRFMICPEMIVSCLLFEKMGPLEAIHIVGAQRYSSYVGYRKRVICDLIAIDALPYSDRTTQYKKENIDRELNKAFAGFMSKSDDPRPIATGNWGCGVFNGDKELKSLIQLLAAAKAKRDVIYCTFYDKQFESSLINQYELLICNKTTVGRY